LENENKDIINQNALSGGRGAGLIKVCGMRNSDNIQQLAELPIDFMGFIFYEKSKRYVANQLDIDQLNNLPKSIQKVGVFVNEGLENIIEIVEKYNLEMVQLHGDESPEFGQNLKQKGIKVIKAFSVDEAFDFSETKPFENVADYFIFDTKTPQIGGSGQSFNWQILEKYRGATPFLLAGGIGVENLKSAQEIKHKMLVGLDLNSKFEIEPGLKDIEKLKKVFK
jgi:phosphoribosylanthranilate isomerase